MLSRDGQGRPVREVAAQHLQGEEGYKWAGWAWWVGESGVVERKFGIAESLRECESPKLK
jgi:hypothetical protein